MESPKIALDVESDDGDGIGFAFKNMNGEAGSVLPVGTTSPSGDANGINATHSNANAVARNYHEHFITAPAPLGNVHHGSSGTKIASNVVPANSHLIYKNESFKNQVKRNSLAGDDATSMCMKEWMRVVLSKAADAASTCVQVQRDAVAVPNNASSPHSARTVCSKEYLTAALKICHSLAGQLCPGRNTPSPKLGFKQFNAGGNHASGRLLPKPSSRWSDQIIIHFSHQEEALQGAGTVLNEKEGILSNSRNPNETELRDNETDFLSDELDDEMLRNLPEAYQPVPLPDSFGRGELNHARESELKDEDIKSMLKYVFADGDCLNDDEDRSKGTSPSSQLNTNKKSEQNCVGSIKTIVDKNVYSPVSERPINSTIPDISASIGITSRHPVQRSQNEHMLGNIRAEILSCDSQSCTQPPESSKENLKRIHALGLVFYELFSGGMIPHHHNVFDRDEPMGLDVFEEKYGEGNCPPSEDPRYDPLNATTSESIDLSSALNIFEDLNSDDEDDSAVGSEGNCGAHNWPRNRPGDDYRAQDEKKVRKKAREPSYLSSFSKSNNLCAISEEPLRLLNLPTNICELIINMIDSINGDLSGEGAYQSMEDVCNDLEWMLLNLNQLITCSNVTKSTRLMLNDRLYGREADVSTIMEAYHRSLAGNISMAVISGASGTGKSQLARALAQNAARTGVLFLSGKFDQLQQANPFSAVASAFNDFCYLLINGGKLEYISTIALKLQNALGKDAYFLTKIVPNLNKIFNTNEETRKSKTSNENNECVNAQKRTHYLLSVFVEVISVSLKAPVILFLDDLQWSDKASLEFLHQLLLRLQHSCETKQFFFLGCCRDDYLTMDTTFRNLINNVRHFGVNTTLIRLKSMSRECVNNMASDLLCLSPRLTRPLADIIHRKTQGNQLFVAQLLKSLNNEGVLRFNLARRRWEWDEEKIASRAIPDDVAIVLADTITRLPNETQKALRVASCFGACFKSSVLEHLESSLGLVLSGPLEVAVAEGLMNEREEQYYFSHDRLQEAAYNMIKPEDACLHHLKYGLSLCTIIMHGGDDSVLFTAVDQINRGGPKAVTDRSQSSIMATFNLRAGKKAAITSDFSAAFSFFDNGISFLRKGHWTEHYDLSLELFVEAAKCALAIGDLASLEVLTGQVLTHATCREDTLAVIYVTISALEICNKPQEAIGKGFSVLEQLGVTFFESSSSWEINGYLGKVKGMLKGLTIHNLLDYKEMKDPTQLMVIKFLARLQVSLLLAKPEAQPEVTLKMVQISLTHGMSPLSPTAFAYYGSLLATLGEADEGYRFIKIALGLLERLNSKESSCEVYAVASQVMTYFEPVQSLGDFLYRGYQLGLISGDTNFALVCLLFKNSCAFWAGEKLPLVKQSIEKTLKLLEQNNYLVWMGHSIHLYRSTLAMIGDSGGFQTPLGKIHANGETETGASMRRSNAFHSRVFLFNAMFRAFIFRKYVEMKHHIEQYNKCAQRSYTVFHWSTVGIFYHGLISFWISRVEKNSVWFARGEKALENMKLLAESSSWNYQHRLHLLEAEKYYCLKDIAAATKCYELSISSAADHKFVNDKALACELMGYFYSEMGKNELAIDCFSLSCESYLLWGAVAKSNTVRKYIEAEYNSFG